MTTQSERHNHIAPSAAAPIWNTDIRLAPHGRYEIKQRREGVDMRVFVAERVVLATKCRKVTISHYQPEVKRWEMLADGEMPVAWAHYRPGQKLPEYPQSNPPSDGDAIAAVTVIDQLADANSVEPSPSGTHSLPPVPLTAADSPALSLPGASGTHSEIGDRNSGGCPSSLATRESDASVAPHLIVGV